MEERVEAAGVEVAEQLRTVLDNDHIEEMKRLQLLILGRLEDGNAVLSHYNDFSERSYAAVVAEFNKNTKLIKSMKADLDYIFKHIRNIKNRITSHHPDAFKESSEHQTETP